MEHRIQIVIADDHEVYRDGLRSLLHRSKELEVAGEASTGKQLLSLCEELNPDVVLTDIKMPVMDGIEATAYIAEHFPLIRVIALSMFNQDHLILDMLNAGASGYLIKNANKNEIIDAVHSVYKNKPYYCSSTSHKLAKLIGASQYGPKARPKVPFSEREATILKMICEEKTTKEIGDELNISARTVEEYRYKLREKMDVKGTAGMVIYAIRNDLFRVEKKDIDQ
jgi:DNA-binding NarL/FixJ family response regulator